MSPKVHELTKNTNAALDELTQETIVIFLQEIASKFGEFMAVWKCKRRKPNKKPFVLLGNATT